MQVFKSNPPPVKRQLFQQNSKKEVPKKPTKDISKDETHKKPTKDISKEVAVVHKKPAKNLSKTVTDAKATKPKQVNSGKAWKDSSVPSKTQVNGIDPGQSGTEQPKAKKRKQSSVQIDSNAQLKKKKVEVEEKKPTE